jgi:hypothetical protein
MGEESFSDTNVCKYYVAKSFVEQKRKKMKKEKNYDEKKRKVR